MTETVVAPVETPEGVGRLFVDAAAEASAVLVLGHGAGGGVAAADLELLARRLPAAGITVVRFEQPWRTKGGKVAVPPPRLDIGWRAAVVEVRAAMPSVPLYVGGRSAGARVACRTATQLAAVGVICLAFPLHPPGQPHRSRVAELNTPSVPRLVLQGTRDAFGTAEEVRAVAGPGVEVVELPGADHGFRTPKGAGFGPTDLRETVLGRTLAFLRVPTGDTAVRTVPPGPAPRRE